MANVNTTNLADFYLPVMASFRRHLLQAESAPDLADSLKAQLDAASTQAQAAGFAAADTKQALFAVVAWLDEQAMGYDWPGAGAWRLTPLQRYYFSTTRAGSEFYQRLDNIDVNNTAVREVYALVLIAGFKGEKGTRSSQLANEYTHALIASVRSQAKHADLEASKPLFPAAAVQPNMQGIGHIRRKPIIISALIIAVPIIIALAVYFYLDFSLGQAVSSLIGAN